MSIEKMYGRFIPMCDVCGVALGGFDSFDEAVKGSQRQRNN